jgi:hypothetical protein
MKKEKKNKELVYVQQEILDEESKKLYNAYMSGNIFHYDKVIYNFLVKYGYDKLFVVKVLSKATSDIVKEHRRISYEKGFFDI